MITIPETTSILDYVGSLFTDLWVFLAIIIGVPLGFFIIQKVLKLADLEKRKEGQIEKQEKIKGAIKEAKIIIEKSKQI